MRTQTRNFVSTLGLGILGVSYFVGAQATANDLQISNVAATAAPTPTATATPVASATPKATVAKKTTTKKTTTKKTTSSSGSGSSTSSGSTGSTKPSGTNSASVNYTVEGDNNVIKLSVTLKDGVITSVSSSGSTATEGRSSAFPSLEQMAIDANGSGFANIGGATYTTKAFKKALDAALAKF